MIFTLTFPFLSYFILFYIQFNRHLSTCILQASSKSSTMTSRNLKGSRKLQFSFNSGSRFTGGITSGTSSAGGSATGSGSAETVDDGVVGVADGTGSGEFTSTSGSSGFIDTVFGSAQGSSAAGATGSQAGNVGITLGGLGTLTFDGTTTSSGEGSFGAGLSPVQFNTVVTEVPGTAIPETSSKGGSTGGGVTPSTFITTVVPVSTGPTGGFGAGSGALDIASTTTGTLMTTGADNVASGVGSSGGEATNFGGGSGSATNFFGTAGGLGSGAGTGAAAAAGITEMDATNAIFTGTGGATGNFNNQGSGVFGASQTLAFP
jgi:hypothetical protein